MEEVEASGPLVYGTGKTCDADNAYGLNNQHSEGNIPPFVSPGPRKKNHKHNPVKPLLQAGTTGTNLQPWDASLTIGDIEGLGIGGIINACEIEQIGTLPKQQVARLVEELLHQGFNRVKATPRPEEIDKVKA